MEDHTNREGGMIHHVLQALPIYQHQESQNKLQAHAHIIKLFRKHLELEWPTNDAAEEQELIGTNSFGMDLGRVVVLKSKHVMETIT